ncbi:MAG: ABC transporter ATP-binding protein, partial [Anaerolineae bacterium]|nr:ABC transporter ATP-binding protein [Anaerolineae bacterium]
MSQTQHNIITLTHVNKTYLQGKTEIPALRNITLHISGGEFIAIMGASGSGKSTLLHVIAGLTNPTSGRLSLFGKDIHALNDTQLTLFRREHVGFIFQTFNLLPTMTALENVALPLLINGQKLRDVRHQAEAMLDLVGLKSRQHHRPDELSGGQQQRVAIARALINQAPLLLADEPTGNLDSKTGEDILLLMRELVSHQKRTIVMVTHDPKAAAYADRIITLSDGQIIDELSA